MVKSTKMQPGIDRYKLMRNPNQDRLCYVKNPRPYQVVFSLGTPTPTVNGVSGPYPDPDESGRDRVSGSGFPVRTLTSSVLTDQ